MMNISISPFSLVIEIFLKFFNFVNMLSIKKFLYLNIHYLRLTYDRYLTF